ncbi:MAG: hypothetical protein WC822_01420 [Candidatus Paceibacterota bacterium]|jgi:hypothetical protein
MATPKKTAIPVVVNEPDVKLVDAIATCFTGIWGTLKAKLAETVLSLLVQLSGKDKTGLQKMNGKQVNSLYRTMSKAFKARHEDIYEHGAFRVALSETKDTLGLKKLVSKGRKIERSKHPSITLKDVAEETITVELDSDFDVFETSVASMLAELDSEHIKRIQRACIAALNENKKAVNE